VAFLQFPGVMEVVAAPTLQPGGLGASLEVGPEFSFAEFEFAKFPSLVISHTALENTPVAAPLRREAAEFLALPLATRSAATAAFRTLAHFDAFTRARRAILAELRELVSLGAAPGPDARVGSSVAGGRGRGGATRRDVARVRSCTGPVGLPFRFVAPMRRPR